MKSRRSGLLAAAIIVMLVLSACANTHSVILVPDPQGRLGTVEVSTAAGTQTLKRANDMTLVRRRDLPPSEISKADPGYIAATFGEALAVEPQPPARFVLYFETGRTELTAESRNALPAIIETWQQRKGIRLSISGHTDSAGSDRLNNALARERAEEIARLLLQEIDPKLISVTSHGKGNPAIPTPDGVAEPRNRRVEVTIH